MSTCAIVGAGPGISQSVARKFLAKGHHIALISRNLDKLQSIRRDLCESDAGVSVWQCDAADENKLRYVIDDIQTSHGEIEVLLFNAYSMTPGRPSVLKVPSLNESLNLNVSACLASAQAVIPSMKKAGKGKILITGGGMAIEPVSKLTALSVGKSALRALAYCLFQELESSNIHVATVTVCGMVQGGTAFDPDLIAECFMTLYEQSRDQFQPEIIFVGK